MDKIAQLDRLQSCVSPCIISKAWAALGAQLNLKWMVISFEKQVMLLK